jgi:hypothetical protein
MNTTERVTNGGPFSWQSRAQASQRRFARSQPRGSSPIACVVGAASAATILPKPLPLAPIARSARGSAAELEELALGVRRRQGGRPLIRGARLALPAQALKQIASGGMKRVVVLEVKLVD